MEAKNLHGIDKANRAFGACKCQSVKGIKSKKGKNLYCVLPLSLLFTLLPPCTFVALYALNALFALSLFEHRHIPFAYDLAVDEDEVEVWPVRDDVVEVIFAVPGNIVFPAEAALVDAGLAIEGSHWFPD